MRLQLLHLAVDLGHCRPDPHQLRQQQQNPARFFKATLPSVLDPPGSGHSGSSVGGSVSVAVSGWLGSVCDSEANVSV